MSRVSTAEARPDSGAGFFSWVAACRGASEERVQPGSYVIETLLADLVSDGVLPCDHPCFCSLKELFGTVGGLNGDDRIVCPVCNEKPASTQIIPSIRKMSVFREVPAVRNHPAEEPWARK